MARFPLAIKAARELGLRRGLQSLVYRAGIRSGLYRLRVRPGRSVDSGRFTPPPLSAPPVDDPGAREQAERLLNGMILLFGGCDAQLNLAPQGPLRHWTHHHGSRSGGKDVKFTWEPARFGWSVLLARAQAFAPAARYSSFFSDRLLEFMAANPPYLGPNWASGQEAALRLIHIVFTAAALDSRPPGLAQTLALHAARIPPTLIYARAQSNNHLLSEAAGLFTAGVVLPGDPRSARWVRSGWRIFLEGLQEQIAPDGAYVQQSTNYHRLALTLALWVRRMALHAGLAYPPAVRESLSAATRRLLGYCDPGTGRVPNLGANDGAHILPLSGLPFSDYRPVLQAAARAFLGAPAFPPGPWDELGSWLGVQPEDPVQVPLAESAMPLPPGLLKHPALDSHVLLRAVVYHVRPGHADQLHADLWWRGFNLALDPGTYLYNGLPPWDNALQSAMHHNTVTIDGQDQMTRAGRFLYVDRARGRFLEGASGELCAEHDGYRRIGVRHRRTVSPTPRGWQVVDEIAGRGRDRHRIRIHWMLPDWAWELDGQTLHVRSPEGPVSLFVSAPAGPGPLVNLIRAGESLSGGQDGETLGWRSPTYGVKQAALSFILEWDAPLPLRLESEWDLNPGRRSSF